DRQDDSSRAGVEASYFEFRDSSSPGTLMRFDLHGQYVDPSSGLGGYAQLPFSYASGGGQTNKGVGDADVGVIYVPKLDSATTKLVAHLGLTLPTGSQGDNGLANLFTGLTRVDDLYLSLPKAITLRAGVSPVIRSGQLFARVDVGVDANLSVNGGSGSNRTADTIVHANAGLGGDFGAL